MAFSTAFCPLPVTTKTGEPFLVLLNIRTPLSSGKGLSFISRTLFPSTVSGKSNSAKAGCSLGVPITTNFSPDLTLSIFDTSFSSRERKLDFLPS